LCKVGLLRFHPDPVPYVYQCIRRSWACQLANDRLYQSVRAKRT